MPGEADITRIWDAIERMREQTGALTTQVAVLVVEMKTVGVKIDEHKAPCDAFLDHLTAHKKREEEAAKAAEKAELERADLKRSFRDVILRLAGPSLSGAAASLATYLGLNWFKGH